jgi:hypothetical protein
MCLISKSNLKLAIACLVGLLLFGFYSKIAEAQVQGEGWSSPLRISTGQGLSSEAALFSDPYGFIHVFWREALPNERTLLMYSRYDGNAWSVPNDIYMSKEFADFKNVSVALGPDSRLHVVWSEGDSGPVYFQSAMVHDALSAKAWSKPYRIPYPASRVKLQVDDKGVMHILYSRNVGEERGVYYIYSKDEGITWSEPQWLDPDILPAHMPANLEFVKDKDGGLHASWFYFDTVSSGGDWVRYTHSLDGGKTWSLPFTIDRLNEREKAAGEKLAFADPVLAVQDETVHILWAGGLLNYRHHRYSTDRGQTWKPDTRVFGELNGQAGEGLVVDGAGRLHLLSQIRWPMAIYHMVWQEDHWSEPSLIYLIRYSSEVSTGENIAAHNTYPVIRAGNELILTLADEPSNPQRRLFMMQYMLDDIPPSPVEPTPTPTPTATPEPSPTPTPVSTVPSPAFDSNVRPPAEIPRPDHGVWLGVAPVLVLLFGAVAFYFVRSVRTR